MHRLVTHDAVLAEPDLQALDRLIIADHNSRHPEPISDDGWTVEWFWRVVLKEARL